MVPTAGGSSDSSMAGQAGGTGVECPRGIHGRCPPGRHGRAAGLDRRSELGCPFNCQAPTLTSGRGVVPFTTTPSFVMAATTTGAIPADLVRRWGAPWLHAASSDCVGDVRWLRAAKCGWAWPNGSGAAPALAEFQVARLCRGNRPGVRLPVATVDGLHQRHSNQHERQATLAWRPGGGSAPPPDRPAAWVPPPGSSWCLLAATSGGGPR